MQTPLFARWRCSGFLGSTLLRTPLRRAVIQPQRRTSAGPSLDFAAATEAARAIRRGEVSSVELTTRLLERIERFNPPLNAIVTLMPDAALARARAADEARARGEWWGPPSLPWLGPWRAVPAIYRRLLRY